MCCRFFVGGDFRRKLNILMKAEGILPAGAIDSGTRLEASVPNATYSGVSQSGWEALASGAIDSGVRQNGWDVLASDAFDSGSVRDVFPSDASTVICERRDRLAENSMSRLTLGCMKWGFSNPYKKGLVINARAETAREKKLFADSVMNRRIVVPASAFYEWDPYKARFRFTLPGDELLLLAGFYREEQGVPRYTILTTEANESMRPVHDRMPVMIGHDEIGAWIRDREKLEEFLDRPQAPLIREQDSGQIRMEFEF